MEPGLGLGSARRPMKLFPFLLLPGFLLAERGTGRWALRRIWIAFVPVAVVTIGQLVAAPRSILSSVNFQLRRGFELSSLQGSVRVPFRPAAR